ncbi:glycosyltransferase family 2 protein [Fibrella aquatilis]|uniref:Glycosyltransferase family 2 protein n=1 Tax=Fibrella aquatilis TaxID=2817059 RepID=A0A939JX66_9BACT|nr:glycosyltransferase family 2 protein [Fibrella aquatilis]MBO0932632.1 glycosyltransferase family 2 protein [Fibrella aquatilis]
MSYPTSSELLFLLLAGLIAYTYVGYGFIIYGLVKLRRLAGRGNRVSTPLAHPADVTLIVPAYNEIDYLPAKLQNCLAQDYPAQHVQLLFVVEGSTDGSAEYLEHMKAQVPNLTVVSGSRRLGKIEAMNNAMPLVQTPIALFTDANTLLNPEAVSRIMHRFADVNVGAVTGEKRISTETTEAASGSGEGLYWRYESFLKRLDAELHTIVGAAGELFAIRTVLYEPVEADTLLDDFMISLRIAGRGYRVDYAPDAYAMERPSHSIREEKKRKVRIAAGGFQSMGRLLPLLNPFRYGWLSFQYISHRVLRWAVAPFCLPLLVLLNLLIVLQAPAGSSQWLFWSVMLLGQVLFYSMAGVGYYLENRQTRWKATFVPYYFVFMNWCVMLGLVRFWNGGLSGIWEKAARAA